MPSIHHLPVEHLLVLVLIIILHKPLPAECNSSQKSCFKFKPPNNHFHFFVRLYIVVDVQEAK